jgi:hypothetical protein
LLIEHHPRSAVRCRHYQQLIGFRIAG